MSSRRLEISAAFAPELSTPDHIVLAESLGFARAWCYDGPAIWADVWMTLARAADRTNRIGLGTAVLVPSYRHVMTTAAAIATLAAQAPDRVVVGIGVGHGNKMMGGRAVPWKETTTYLATLRALLNGETVDWEGSPVQLMHNSRFAAQRPVRVPFLLAAQGPKGLEYARTVADGVITAMVPNHGFEWSAVLLMGTVLPDDGCFDPEYVMQAAGPAAAAAYHTTYSADWRNGPALARAPNFDAWVADLEKTPAERRHLAAWSQHLIGLTPEDRVALTPEAVRMMTFTGTKAELRDRLQDLQAKGATEVIYQPTGPDIPGELRRFAAMAGL
jgi:5,10-methylenetetrahydromethanopterin reductase